jgi:hypothetical protein
MSSAPGRFAIFASCRSTRPFARSTAAVRVRRTPDITMDGATSASCAPAWRANTLIRRITPRRSASLMAPNATPIRSNSCTPWATWLMRISRATSEIIVSSGQILREERQAAMVSSWGRQDCSLATYQSRSFAPPPLPRGTELDADWRCRDFPEKMQSQSDRGPAVPLARLPTTVILWPVRSPDQIGIRTPPTQATSDQPKRTPCLRIIPPPDPRTYVGSALCEFLSAHGPRRTLTNKKRSTPS